VGIFFGLAISKSNGSYSADTSRKLGLPKKRKAAAWNSEFLAQVLGMGKI
jgi:hypothetical protein